MREEEEGRAEPSSTAERSQDERAQEEEQESDGTSVRQARKSEEDRCVVLSRDALQRAGER